MVELTEGQRAFVHRVVAHYGIIDVKIDTHQWRINPVFLATIEVQMQDKDAFDSVKRAVAAVTKKATHEERIVITSFVMEFVVQNYSNITIPEVMNSDLKDSRELIDYLMEEERKNLV